MGIRLRMAMPMANQASNYVEVFAGKIAWWSCGEFKLPGKKLVACKQGLLNY